MQTANSPMEKEINGCRMTIYFSPKPVEGVLERIKEILSSAYDERVQNDLSGIVNRRNEND